MARAKFFHTQEYHFVPDPAGEFVLAGTAGDDGEPLRARRELQRRRGGVTDADFPPDYQVSMIALTQYVENLTTHHAPSERIGGVWCEDEKLARQLAALLDAQVVGENGEALGA